MLPEELFVFSVVVIAGLLALLMLPHAYKRRLDFKLRKLELETRAQAFAIAPPATDDRADLLEDRVRVLERIATDRGQDIAHQIERLRDRRQEEKL